mmetsp:Transcript_41516/g.98403  ORF Transcript_41516/g.98403 Transcript_41516/m.98403 type:complete len:167 (+) Transcript_41516:462-962(+)|eukprot:CAMPEP_0180173816 /NCGR_PEP_ID=MMETSP0986-20121125/35789_1 /TAXON_ID=697907 /ORGANISM="non described non described, Strain CCMP2293" /LENGTH=166 /DNA_ID=CAMNT_0022126053 /DNA_START=413 /DNA_END=913 /DNA_ORIENTATION=+
MQRHVLALALFALIAAPAVHAGCCTDKCKGKHSTAASCKGSPAGEFPRKDAGCAADNQEGDCSCDWSYQGAQTTANGCVDLDDSSSSELWDCTGAPDYETKGECQDPIEILGEVLGAVAAGIGGVLIGIIVAAVVVPIIIIILVVWCCCCRNQQTTVVVTQAQPAV